MTLPPSMAAIEMREPGGPDVLQSATRPLPVLHDHEILVKVAAAGVNGPDLVQRRGHYPPPKALFSASAPASSQASESHTRMVNAGGGVSSSCTTSKCA